MTDVAGGIKDIDPYEYPSSWPDWVRWGDMVAEFVVLAILVVGFFTAGYAGNYDARGVAWFGCVLLGIWSLVGMVLGRWDGPTMRPARWLLVLMLVPLAWWGIMLIPLPSDTVASLSPLWKETREVAAQTGMTVPGRIALAHSPAKGLLSFEQLLASICFFSGVCMLASRRSTSIHLLVLMALVCVAEGLMGLVTYILNISERATGGVYNPNHHAALVAMTLPAYFGLLIFWSRRSKAMRGPILGGSNPILIFYGIGLVLMVGWLAGFSRGSLLLSAPVLVGWVVSEWWGTLQRQERSRHDPEIPLLARLRGYILGLAVGLVLLATLAMLLSAGQVAKGISRRGWDAWNWRTDGRLEIWRATLMGLRESPWLGIGPAGAEQAMTRFAETPTDKNAIWSHNDYVQVVAELGVPATIVALFVLGCLAAAWRRESAARAKYIGWTDRHLERVALVGVLSALAHAATDFHLRIPLIGFVFLILLALVVAPGPLFATTLVYRR